jgi:hypothetical protein
MISESPITQNISILLYADATVLIAENENDLQLLLDILNTWCKHKALNVNFEKTKIALCCTAFMHEKPRVPQMAAP